MDDGTQPTGCTQPPGHRGTLAPPPGPAPVHSLRIAGSAKQTTRRLETALILGLEHPVPYGKERAQMLLPRAFYTSPAQQRKK